MEKPLSARPSRRLAVVACMDCRLDLEGALGLAPGEAHVLRNAGGVVTDDTIRSLAISQRRLGTREVMVVHHTDCGMEGLDEQALASELAEAAGSPPGFALGGFADAEEDVRRSVRLLRGSPFLPHRERVRGYLYDVDSHAVREVELGDERRAQPPPPP